MNEQDIAKQQQKARNDANNANNIRVALDAAAKSGNAYAKAGVAIDKITGGKASALAGKAVTAASKHSLHGKMLQSASNKLSESGTSQRIAQATNAKNGKAPNTGAQAANAKSKPTGKANGKSSFLSDTKKRETEEQSSDHGGTNFWASFKVVKIGLIAMIPITFVMIIICLFTSASQIMINSVGLGHADALSGEDAEKKIDKKLDNSNKEKELNREVDDENANRAAFYYDIDDSFTKFRESKLSEYNLTQVVYTTTYLKRKYNEASLDELEDFYPEVVQYAKEYDTDTVYDFFFKLYYVYKTYKEEYNVKLDLPLLMATLNVQSEDKVIVFSSNLSEEDKDINKRPMEDFYYDKDWSFYVSDRNHSEHDIEILAQHMVSSQVTEYCLKDGKIVQEHILRDEEIGHPGITCGEGETYLTTTPRVERDDNKYKEYLKEFIEKKYYADGITIDNSNNTSSNNSNNNNNNSSNNSNNSGNSGSSNSNYNPPTNSGSWRSWRQCGAAWSGLEVGKSGDSMCQIGCLITSISIQIARSGTYTTTTPVDPGVAVKTFDFTPTGALYWYSVSKLAPNFKYGGEVSLVGLSKKSIAEKLSSYDPSKYYLVLAVSKKDRTKPHHYVALDYVDLNSNNLYMIDPAADETSVYDIYKLYAFHIYKKGD